MDYSKRFRVKPGSKVNLKKFDPAVTPGFKTREEADEMTARNIAKMDTLQSLFYADNRFGLLIVLQSMDGGGKDGTIRHVMSGLNPQGAEVTSFKVPSAEEMDHDYLWRVHHSIPARGDFGIFNRSHYEDVLVTRVHKLVSKDIWQARYEQINVFEKYLADNNIITLKFFLHISNDEQKRRFQQRIDDPKRNWKISNADFSERKLWDDYQDAYGDALEKCSTAHAPWYIIPANNKWFRNLAISQIILEKLESLDLSYPKPLEDLSKIVLE